MTTPAAGESFINELALDPRKLTHSAIQGVRIAFGVSGAAAFILGILLLIWPGKTITVAAVLLGIYFVIAGIARLALGVFGQGSAGHRVLGIIFGLLMLFAGIIALRNSQTTALTLVILVVAVVGIGWIIDGVIAIVESRNAQSTVWAIVFGAISIVAGIVMLVVPSWAATWLVFVSGVSLVILGIFGIMRAFSFGRAVKA